MNPIQHKICKPQCPGAIAQEMATTRNTAGTGEGIRGIHHNCLTDSPPDLLFACPYSKSDPLRYSQWNPIEMNYRGCSSRCLRDISRVKQHLYRVHRRPDHYCGSCFQEFDTQDLLDTHSRQRPACEVSQSPFSEKMTQDQLNSIKRRKPGKDACETWYNIFKILFPNAPLPDSPYYDTVSPMAVQSFSERFRSQAPPLLSTMVRDRTQDFVSRRIRTGDP